MRQHNVTIAVGVYHVHRRRTHRRVVAFQIAVIVSENCESNLLSNLVCSQERGRMMAKMFSLLIYLCKQASIV